MTTSPRTPDYAPAYVPGPWEVEKGGEDGKTEVHDPYGCTCTVHGLHDEEHYATARLIAAAPALGLRPGPPGVQSWVPWKAGAPGLRPLQPRHGNDPSRHRQSHGTLIMPNHYTPGPWHSDAGFITGRFQSDGQVHDICDPRCAPVELSDEMDANARLIAAAPDLLNALEMAVVTIKRLAKTDSVNGTLDVANAAIAKATGA